MKHKGPRLLDPCTIYICCLCQKKPTRNRAAHCSIRRYLVRIVCLGFFSSSSSFFFLSCSSSFFFLSCSSSFLSTLFCKSRIETETCLFINADYYLLAFVWWAVSTRTSNRRRRRRKNARQPLPTHYFFRHRILLYICASMRMHRLVCW